MFLISPIILHLDLYPAYHFVFYIFNLGVWLFLLASVKVIRAFITLNGSSNTGAD